MECAKLSPTLVSRKLCPPAKGRVWEPPPLSVPRSGGLFAVEAKALVRPQNARPTVEPWTGAGQAFGDGYVWRDSICRGLEKSAMKIVRQ